MFRCWRLTIISSSSSSTSNHLLMFYDVKEVVGRNNVDGRIGGEERRAGFERGFRASEHLEHELEKDKTDIHRPFFDIDRADMRRVENVSLQGL